MLNIERLIAIVVISFVAAPAYAQTPPATGRTFVDASFGAARDDMRNDEASGATWASGFAWGGDSGTWGFELGVAVPQWHEKPFPALRYRYAGPTDRWHQQNHNYESSSIARRRSIDVTGLVRANRPINRRVTFTWLVGGGYVIREDRSTGVTKEVLADGQLVDVHTQKSTSFRNYLAAVTRLDLELKVSARVSIVPRVRLTVFPSLVDDSGDAPRMFVARPEVAVRWRLN